MPTFSDCPGFGGCNDGDLGGILDGNLEGRGMLVRQLPTPPA